MFWPFLYGGKPSLAFPRQVQTFDSFSCDEFNDANEMDLELMGQRNSEFEAEQKPKRVGFAEPEEEKEGANEEAVEDVEESESSWDDDNFVVDTQEGDNVLQVSAPGRIADLVLGHRDFGCLRTSSNSPIFPLRRTKF